MKVLVTSPLLTPADRELLDSVVRQGIELQFAPNRGGRSPAELALLAQDVAGIIAGSDVMDRTFFAATPRLRVIARVGVGYDAIDLEAAHSAGVIITTTPGANDQTVADYTLGLMLALLRKVPANHDNVSNGRWERAIGVDLTGKTVGVVGLGRIGKLVVRRLSGFDVTILGHELLPDLEFNARYQVELLPFDELLRRADIVSFHVNLSSLTTHMLDERRIGLVKPSAYVINTCRGGVIDERALSAALNEGRVAGAALDVFEDEPAIGRAIVSARNVIVSAHVAGISLESKHRMAAIAIDETLRVLTGAEPRFPVRSS